MRFRHFVLPLFGMLIFFFSSLLHARDNGAIFLFDYQNAETRTGFQTQRLLDRVIRICDWAIPQREDRFQLNPEILRENVPQNFSNSVNLRRHEIKITLPAAFAAQIHDGVSLRRLVVWVLLAKIGKTPDQEKKLWNHWITSAIVHKIILETTRLKMPFTRSYPAAGVLAAYGIFPDLQKVLSPGDSTGIPPVLDAVNAEYADLLLDCCHSAGMLKKELAANLLLAVCRGSDDPVRDFFRLAAKSLPRSKKEISELPAAEQASFWNAWFRRSIERSVLAFYAPLSPVRFEECYAESVRFTLRDENGRETLLPLSRLPAHWALLPNPNATVSGLMGKLMVLGIAAPGLLREPLSQLRLALTRLHTDRSPEAEAALIAADREIYRQLTRQVELELFLAQAERQMVPPGMRMAQTLEIINRRNSLPLKEVELLLDQWDNYK